MEKEYNRLIRSRYSEVELPKPVFRGFKFEIVPVNEDIEPYMVEAIKAASPTVSFVGKPFIRVNCTAFKSRGKFLNEKYESYFVGKAFSQKLFLESIYTNFISDRTYDKLSEKAKQCFYYDHSERQWHCLNHYYKINVPLNLMKVEKSKQFYTHQKVPENEILSRMSSLYNFLCRSGDHTLDHHFGYNSNGYDWSCPNKRYKSELDLADEEIENEKLLFEKNQEQAAFIEEQII